ncbi:MAG: SDR family NAD(P)-dependent oxidoreductase, partial [Planctomycetales bacterium]|nr:SDR family NAD(P)-dependent oxidoreductase [Planctomycetales bacterium]
MQGAHAPGLQWLPSVRRQGDDWGQLTKTIAALYTAGVDIDWMEFDRPYQRRAVAYPNYPFQRSQLQETATKQSTERAPATVVRPAVSIPDDTALPIEENSFPVFELEWVQRSVAGMSATGNRHWLVIGSDPLANSLSSSLVKLGDEVQQLDLNDAERGVSEDTEGSTDSRVVDWIQEQCERFANVDGVIFTSSLDCRARDQDLPIALQELLHLVQSLSSTGRELSQRLWVLTRGAAPIAMETIDDAAAMIWGMVQTVSVEVRQLRPACIDLDNESDIQQDVESVLGCLNARDSETHIAIRGDKRLVQRLVRVEPPNTVTKNSIRPDASYLVTGGLGGVGVCVAKWLCEQGARSVHLVSRRDPDDELKDELNQWARKHHSEVRFHRADVSIRADVDRVIQGIESDGKPLAGLLHLAGAHRDGAIVNLSWDDFLFTAQSKVSGALHLHEATQSLPLDWFVAFSSVASVVGSPGQANYAASNAFLDSLMHSRRKQGLPGLSLNWGPWDEVGMAAQLPASKKRRWEAMGVSMIQPEQGLQLLSKLIAGDSTQSVVVPADWSKMLCLFPPGLEPPLLENFIDANRQLSDPSPQWQQLKQKALQVPVNRRSELVARFVEALVRDVLDMPSEEPLDRTAGFADLGMDSLMGVELRNHLQQHLGTEMTLTATVAFNYPNVATLSEYLAKEVLHARVASPQVALNRDRNTSHEPIAIVGCALRFPGGINDLDSYWQLLQTGGIAVEEIPDSRWQVSEYYDPDPDRPGYMNTRWAGLMDDLDKFDASFFGISPREAAKMDPQHRIVLETVWSALENGCIPPRSIFGTKTAVFLGISGNDYVSRLSRASAREDIDAYLAAGNAQHVAAGRISHFFGLHGPSIALDTACSSSLVAVHLAHESLQSGESELAVAGGVNVLLAPEISISLSKAHMMAKDGRCKTFSDAADGYVRSERCGFIVMKRLSDAQRDGNRIFALVRGSCVNHDGRCSAVTVPNGDSQQMLVRQALKNASLTPDSIDYVETHGTGTSLGDPIEVDALGNVFSDRLSTDRLILGSVKANLGHLESAAGIAGLLKVLAMLRHGQFPPQPPFERLNSHVDWENSCVQVSRELMAWPRIENETRYAGVSSFSFGGTNAHVVLSDPPLKSDPVDYTEGHNNDAAHTQLVVLSAKSESALNRQVDRLVDSLTDQSLSDVAFTLAAGRDPLNHRIAIMATSIEQLAAGLRDYRQDGGHHAVSYRSIRGSHIPDIGLLLCNLAAFDEERVDPLLASCPQVALDYAAETKAFFDIGDLELSATQEKAARWTILQAVLAGHAMRWFSDAPTLAGYGVGRYASLAASGLIRPCEAARLSVMHIAAAERLLKNAGDVLLLVAGDASNALLRLPADRSIVCVPASQLNELENAARQRGQIFERLGTE